MRLTMVGCSGSMPGPNSAASCYLLEADGFRLVVDLGNGAVRRAAAAGAFGGAVSLAAPGQVLDLGYEPRGTPVLS